MLLHFLTYLCLVIKSGNASANDSVTFVKINHETSIYIVISFYIIAVSSIKLLYTWVECFSKFIPESNLLLLCGLALGFGIDKMDFNTIKSSELFRIKSNTFFYIFLPPIILESSFSIYHKAFASNLIGVLIFSVVATMLNFFAIAIGLLVLFEFNYMDTSNQDINSNTIWIFSSLIVAVDPVAVLGIFQEIHVDNNLYYLVFGESLLNDGVSVVLYDVMIEMSTFPEVNFRHILTAIVSFALVGLGGSAIGFFISTIACLVTRYTVRTPIIEPIIVMTFGYLSYLLANAISWSGIISMIVYGVIQAAYGFQNITSKSLILIKRLSKILSSLSESMIFLNLGVTVMSMSIDYLSPFIMWSTFLCLYCRFIFTLLCSAIINYFRFNIRKIRWNEQFIIAYGGLRGGIAFCLSELINKNVDCNKKLIGDTTVFIIMFTVMFMGFTIKPLVKMLNIQIAKPEELCIFVQVTESALEHLLAGIEAMTGMKGRNAFYELLANLDEEYVRPILQRDRRGKDEKIMKMFEKMNLTMHMATTAAGTPMSDYYLHKLKPHMRNRFESCRTSGVSFSNMDTVAESDKRRSSDAFYVKNVLRQNLLFLPIDNLPSDPDALAKRMNSMIGRKRRSLVVSNVKRTFAIKRASLLTMESEITDKIIFKKLR